MQQWTLGPIVRVRCTNHLCEKHDIWQIVRWQRMGDVYMTGPLRCAKCLWEMEVKNKALVPKSVQQ